jgi:hypothetical protein
VRLVLQRLVHRGAGIRNVMARRGTPQVGENMWGGTAADTQLHTCTLTNFSINVFISIFIFINIKININVNINVNFSFTFIFAARNIDPRMDAKKVFTSM